MHRHRIIPVLLLHNNGLVKSVKFKNYRYVGDPINAVRIFNEKEVDELIILDIDASRRGLKPNFNQITEIVSEAFMPVAYGGGITSMEDAKTLFYNGVEKVILNSVLFKHPEIISDLSSIYGSQSLVASIDVKYNMIGKPVVHSFQGLSVQIKNPVSWAVHLEKLGIGEIMINVIDRDGTYNGYDLDLLQKITTCVSVPVIICGGASNKDDFSLAKENGASAMAAGSMFVFKRPHQAVLISYDI